MCSKVKTNTCINCHSLRSVQLTHVTCRCLSCGTISSAKILRYFAPSNHRNFVSLGDFSIDHTNFLRKCFEFLKKDHEISFEISLKIRENKGQILMKFALITFAQYCTSNEEIKRFLHAARKDNFMILRSDMTWPVCSSTEVSLRLKSIFDTADKHRMQRYVQWIYFPQKMYHRHKMCIILFNAIFQHKDFLEKSKRILRRYSTAQKYVNKKCV